MKTAVLLSLASLAAALSGGMHTARDHKRMAKRMVAKPATISEGSYAKRAPAHRRSRATKRKTPGGGDSTSQPANIADGTFTAAQGCAVWHTVSDGEVCLGLIDKSSASFTLDKFFEFNPSLASNCDNLVTGIAYCVDTEAGGKEETSTPATQQAAVVKPAATQEAISPARVAAVSTDEDEDSECEEDDSSDEEPVSTDSDDSDDEECEEEEDSDSSVSVSVSTSSKKQPTTSQSQSQDSDDSSDDQDDSDDSESQSSSSTSSSSSSSGSSGKTLSQFQGVGTWYEQNGNPGNCGEYKQDSDMIVALYTSLYNGGEHCNKKVRLTNTANGKTVEATVMDSCPSCSVQGNIDLSRAVFGALSDDNFGLGVLDVKWGFV